jgi:Cu/Ag efflux protein CusF
MDKRIFPLLAACLIVGGAAHAQFGGSHHRRGAHAPSDDNSSSAPETARAPKSAPVNEVEIIGVVQAIDPPTNRMTIAYQAVEARGWPPGVMPFVVSRTALFKDVTVGEKVRFKLDSEQISELRPF